MQDTITAQELTEVHADSAAMDPIPITRIGIETELSRYPIHNLSKTGNVNIQITKKGPAGEIDLRWEVSYSDRYGQPRQLAYKLDTILVNRRIDEEGRPVPRLIRLGSLNDLCKELGSQKSELKRALQQNATTSINAKLAYRGVDGSEHQLEALFNRYSVVFTGQKLPDGSKADSVYLVLNDIYREELNNAPIRPLNYEYLKALAPAPQRFYEIISTRIYAALKNRNPLARILYSEFCTYSALTRHFDYENFRVQMAKIHRPHLKLGYIAKAHFEVQRTEDGVLDWMMCYQPGPRARAEYMTFARKTKRSQQEVLDIEARDSDAEVHALLSMPAPASKQRSEPRPDHPLLPALTERGISLTKARKLLVSLPKDQAILDQIEWADHLIAAEPRKFTNPAGFYVTILTENIAPPASFESRRLRKAREEAQQKADADYFERERQKAEYEEYCSNHIEHFARSLPQSDLDAIIEDRRKNLGALAKGFERMSKENQQILLWGMVKAHVKPRVTLATLEEFLARRVEETQAQPSLFEFEPLEINTPQVLHPEPIALKPRAPRTAPAAAALVNEDPVNDDALRQSYENWRGRKVQALLESLNPSEKSQRRSAARTQLLTTHPDRNRFHTMMDDGRFDDLAAETDRQLVSDIESELKLPDFNTWKNFQ